MLNFKMCFYPKAKFTSNRLENKSDHPITIVFDLFNIFDHT